MRALLAAGLLLAAFALPVGAKAADPFLTLDTPGPYHYGQTITVTAHGTLPHPHGDLNVEAQLFCRQSGQTVYIEKVTITESEQPYALHLGQWGLSQWDLNGGGAADCRLHFYQEAHRPATIWTEILFHVEA